MLAAVSGVGYFGCEAAPGLEDVQVKRMCRCRGCVRFRGCADVEAVY